MVALRLLECAAIGAAVACALALMMTPLLVWRQVTPLPLVLVMLAVGTLMGLISALTDRQGMDAAAREADRQLDLHDLLSTAWSLRTAADAWSRAVLAMADVRCTRLAPGQVVLNRLGARSWGGIVAGVTLTLGVAALYSIPAPTLADAGGQSPFATAEQLEREARLPAHAVARVPQGGEDRPVGSSASAAFDPAGIARSISSEATDAARSSGHTGAIGQGSGESRSPAQLMDRRAATSAEGASMPDSGDGAGGERAAGAGADPATAGLEEAGGLDASALPRQRVPAWQAPTWSAARNQAMDAVRTGTIPDPYRALVRDYFDREAVE